MIILLNLALYAILALIVFIGYLRYKQTKDPATILSTMVVLILVSVLYNIVQPSYMPKGKAKPMQGVPFEIYEEIEIKDISIKALSKEKRQERFDEIITVREEVKAVLSK